MPSADSVFQEIKDVLTTINDVVTSDEFAAAKDAISILPGLGDIWEAITEGLGVVFDALITALNTIKDQSANIDPIINFASSMNTLLGHAESLVTGDAATALSTIQSKVDTISSITGDVVALIDDIIALIGTIKGALGIS